MSLRPSLQWGRLRGRRTAKVRRIDLIVNAAPMLFLSAAIIIVLSGCGSSEQIVAEVAGAPIAATSLRHWESVDAKVYQGTGAARIASIGRALNFLILSTWLEGEARDRHLEVAPAQASEQLGVLAWDEREHLRYERLPRDTQLKGYLNNPRVSPSDRLWLMRLTMIVGRLEQQWLARALREVTPAQIARFYRYHKKQFWRPERRDLEVIGNSNLGVVVKAKREIEAGVDFLQIAKRVSTDQEAPGGLEHPLARGEEEPDYDRVVFAAPPHKLIGPVEQAFYYIFEVIRIRPAHEESLALAAATIKRRLANQRAQSVLRAQFEQTWRVRTTCHLGHVSARCRGTGAKRV